MIWLDPKVDGYPPHKYWPVLILFRAKPNLENRIVTGYWDGEQWGPYRARVHAVSRWAEYPLMPDGYWDER
jgi:hypothetical protein